MRLTRKKSIELCIELWAWLAKTGKRKEEWPEWDKYENLMSGNYCWFCEYTEYRASVNGEGITWRLPCEKYCPWHKKHGTCQPFANNRGKLNNYEKWERAETLKDRKKYARLFLKQIKEL